MNRDREGAGDTAGAFASRRWPPAGVVTCAVTRSLTVAVHLDRVSGRNMDRYWFFTWRTYGTWLPGRAGFVGEYVTTDGLRVTDNRYGDPAGPAMPLAAYSAFIRNQPAVFLSGAQAAIVFEQLVETAAYRGRVLDAVAILTDHIHLVFGTPADPDQDKMLDDWKTYASRVLNRHAGWKAPAPRPVWWARDGSKRILKTPANRAGAIRYVRDQHDPLRLWVSDAATQVLAEYSKDVWVEPGELGEPGEPRP